jgi:hypothetical protein
MPVKAVVGGRPLRKGFMTSTHFAIGYCLVRAQKKMRVITARQFGAVVAAHE